MRLHNTKLIRFTIENYRNIFLSSSYQVSPSDSGVVLQSNNGEEGYIIQGNRDELMSFFLTLIGGVGYEAIWETIPNNIDDKESFIAELWQRGIIL